MNLLLNPSFENGWTDINESVQQPNDWHVWWTTDVENTLDPGGHPFLRPEYVHKLRNQLPEIERDIFILDGDTTYKMFKGSGAWYGGLVQDLYLEPDTYEFTVKVFADLVKDYKDGVKVWADDPEGNDGLLRFVLNDHAYDWMSLAPGQWNKRTLEFAANGQTRIGVEIMCPFPLDNAGVFVDDWSLIEVKPDAPVARGAPREQYQRIYNVIPATTPTDEAVKIFRTVWDEHPETFGPSYDDAGVGDLDDRTAVLWNVPAEVQQEYGEWYENWYPGVKVEFASLDEPADTPPQYTTPKELISIHRQTNIDGLYEYIETVKPEWVKLVGGFQDAKRVKEVSPDTKVLIRHVTANQGQFINNLDVEGFLAQFSDDLEALGQWIDAFEGTNEEAPNDELVRFCCKLSEETYRRYGEDIALCGLNLAVGNGESDVLLPAAVYLEANQHYFGYHSYFPCNLQYAEDWMETAAEWYHMRHLLHLDPYFVDNGVYVRYLETESGAVRADEQQGVMNMLTLSGTPAPVIPQSWYVAKKRTPMIGAGVDEDTARALFTRAYFTSYAEADPGGLDPAGGWRHAGCLNGDRPRCINLIKRKREKIMTWNAQHGNRDRASFEFTVGLEFVGWKNYKWWNEDLTALGKALTGD